MMRLIFFIVLIMSIGLVPFWVKAQDCEEKIKHANTEFEHGRYFNAPKILEKCLNAEITNEQKVRAYHLLTQAYILLGEKKLADESYLNLLRASPEYVATDQHDPIDVVYISRKFTTSPIFEHFFKFGLNGNLNITLSLTIIFLNKNE